MGVDCHFDLIGSNVLDGIGHSSIAIEAQYHELSREPMRHDFLQNRRTVTLMMGS